MAFGQGHGGIKADDFKLSRHIKDYLDNLLPQLGIEIIELGRVIPGHGGAIIAMIDVPSIAIAVIVGLKDHGCVAAVIIMVFQMDTEIRVL